MPHLPFRTLPKQALAGIFVGAILIVGIPATLFLNQHAQDIRQHAAGGTCPTATIVPGSYISGNNCTYAGDFTGDINGSYITIQGNLNGNVINGAYVRVEGNVTGYINGSYITVTGDVLTCVTGAYNQVGGNVTGSVIGTTNGVSGTSGPAGPCPPPTPTPTATPIPPSATPTLTPVPPTATPLPPTATPTDTPVPTNTPTITPSPTATPLPPTATPTATPIPPTATLTPTLPPKETALSFSLLLDGIGAAGDNEQPQPSQCQRIAGHLADPTACFSNQAPQHPERSITVEVVDGNVQIVKTVSGTATYNEMTGKFTGRVNLGTNWISGFYNVKVSTPAHLKAQTPGIQSIVAGEENTTPPVNLVTADADQDNKLTILDFSLINTCYTFPGMTSACNEVDKRAADVNDDGNNDEFDQNLFLREIKVLLGE